jgi:hypothetical protein
MVSEGGVLATGNVAAVCIVLEEVLTAVSMSLGVLKDVSSSLVYQLCQYITSN